VKLLFDQNISFRIVKKLADVFEGCQHVSDCGLLNSEDPSIWEYARQNNYAIVSFDSDFYDISIINGHPPKIIWIRTGNLTTEEIAHLLLDRKLIIDRFLTSHESENQSCLEIEQD